MADLYLKDLLNLSIEEANRSKIALNMQWGGRWHRDRYFENGDVEYSYSPFYGKSHNFRVGEICFGFVQLENRNHWLLVTVGEITSVPDSGSCSRREIERFRGYIGKLVVEINKGNTYSRYVFWLSKFLDEAKVVEILPRPYEPISFKGYDEVVLSYRDLQNILKMEKYEDYRKVLSAVKGVYVLADKKTGKLYIGSAYGEYGLAQRWNCYLDTKTGGNQGLTDLYHQKGESYFLDNFQFALLEFFGSNTDDSKIISRETHWKNVLLSKDFGYNKN